MSSPAPPRAREPSPSPAARSRFSWSSFSPSRPAATSSTPASPKQQLLAPNLGLESLDLASDYEELANAIEGLGYLESGITDPLNRYAATANEWARIMRNTVRWERRARACFIVRCLQTLTFMFPPTLPPSPLTPQTGRSTEELQSHLHAILSYSSTHRSVLKLRDQKQLDFEELTDYLSSVVSERDRLASLSSPHGHGHGHGGVRGPGLTGFLKDRVDALRGVDEERTRVERMARLDGRIAELQDAVTTAHDVSVAFSAEVGKENKTFHMAKDVEMKELMGAYADGQVEMWRRGAEIWDALIPRLEAIKVDV